MSTTLPSGLTKPDSGVQGWDSILNDNWDLLDDRLENVLTVSSANRLGSQAEVNANASTAQALTPGPGTASDTIAGAGATYDETTMNNIVASLTDEINKLRADRDILQTTLNNLLADLRTMGVLAP